MTPIIIARDAPAPSSPAQVRAAPRLRGPDGPTRPSANTPAMSSCHLVNLTVEEERFKPFREVMTPDFPSEVPTPGRWIRSDRMSARGTRPRFHRLVDLSSQTPLGGGQRADPVQKHDPGERI